MTLNLKLNKLSSKYEAMRDHPYLQGEGLYFDGDDTLVAILKDEEYDLELWMAMSPSQLREEKPQLKHLRTFNIECPL